MSAPQQRVVWLVKQLDRGGTESLLVHLAGEFASRASLTVAYVMSGHDDLVPAFGHSAEIVDLGARGVFDLRWVLALRRLMARDEVVVVHSHSPVPAIAARLVARTLQRRCRPRVVCTQHSPLEHYRLPTRVVERATAILDDEHIAVSEHTLASLPARVATRARVLHHGIAMAPRRPTEAERLAARSLLDIPADVPLVMTIANLRPVKDYPTLVRAAAEVLRDVPAARFVAIGGGEEERVIQELIDRRGLRDHFRLAGTIPEASSLLAAADVFVLSSSVEGYPVSLMEAQCSAVPVVATAAGGVPEIIEDGVSGILVPTGDAHGLANALRDLLLDPMRRAQFSDAGLRAAERHDVVAVADRLASLYAEILAGG